MIQRVIKPSRHRNDQSTSVLDLIFTLDPNMVTDIEHLSPLSHIVITKSYIVVLYMFVTMILKHQIATTKLTIISGETMLL